MSEKKEICTDKKIKKHFSEIKFSFEMHVYNEKCELKKLEKELEEILQSEIDIKFIIKKNDGFNKTYGKGYLFNKIWYNKIKEYFEQKIKDKKDMICGLENNIAGVLCIDRIDGILYSMSKFKDGRDTEVYKYIEEK